MAQPSRRHSANSWTATRHGGADLCKLRRLEHRVGVHYFPYCGENALTNSANFSCTKFSEVQLRDEERRSVRRVISSSCSQPSPTKEESSSMRKSPRDRSSPCSAMSARSRGKPNISPLGSCASTSPSPSVPLHRHHHHGAGRTG